MSKITVIKSQTRLFSLSYFREIWQYRELLFTFVKRDIKVRYKQTLIGGAWAIIQPFSTMVVFSFFFGKLAKMPSDGIPYPIFSYSGLLLWVYFSNAINNSSRSIVSNASLITKVYFPRIIAPLAASITGLVDYLIASFILFGLMIYYQIDLSWQVLLVPVVVFFTFLLAAGAGMFLSAVNAKYRDVGFVLPFFIQLLLFVTPVIYPASVAGRFKWIIQLNPMAGLVEAHRALLLSHQPVNFQLLSVSALLILLIFIAGLFYFRRTEGEFADVI